MPQAQRLGPRTRGPKLEPHQVILRPLITEKGTHLSTHRRAFTFEVNLWATKEEIKAAAEFLFNVKVTKVRTQLRLGKKKRLRLGKKKRYRFLPGQLPSWKKAIITLSEDSGTLEFF